MSPDPIPEPHKIPDFHHWLPLPPLLGVHLVWGWCWAVAEEPRWALCGPDLSLSETPGMGSEQPLPGPLVPMTSFL